MKVSAVEQTSTPIWNNADLNEGASIEGIYVKSEVFEGKFGETTKYIIDVNGEKFAIFGSASLDRQFKNVPQGKYVYVTYNGKETTKNGRTVKVYTVEYETE